jgi:aldose sugar dehydrogenase
MRSTINLVFGVSLLACPVAPALSQAPRSPTPASTDGMVRVDTVARGLVNPWALAFLPDGRILVTERPGRLRIVAVNGTLSEPLTGVPEVHARGQGGLLDVALDPRFAENRLVYLSYAEAGEGGAGTAVARGRLGDAGLENVQVIFRQRPKLAGNGHFGSRLVFGRDGTLFITTGDRQAYRDSAQSLAAGQGKIMRINADGTIPRDNPFVNRAGVQPEIWSYGHRNLQGAALHPETGRLWTVEHGPRGGDELNHPEAGKNYGWPVIGYGINYDGTPAHASTTKEGMEQPVYYWDPVIAASGMAFYTADQIPGWKGSVLIGSMTPTGPSLVRLTFRNGMVATEERYLGSLKQRIRDVQQGPDGYVYVVTDHTDGMLLRLRPM